MPTVRISDAVIHYEEFGSGSPLLLLHGSGANYRLFEPQIASLGQHHRLIIPHMRGHMESSPLPKVEYYHQLMADDTQQFLRAVGLDRVPVYGESMGAVVALLLAIRHPSCVERLIPVCGFSEMPDADSAALLWLSNAVFSLLPMKTIVKLMLNVYPLHEEGNALARQVLLNSICIEKPFFVQLKTSKLLNFTDQLHRITAPTLIMGGTGLKLEERGSRNLYEHISGATLALFKGGKDPLSATRQAAHDALVLDFLADRPLTAQAGVTLFGPRG